MLSLESSAAAMQQAITWLQAHCDAATGVVRSAAGVVQQLRTIGGIVFARRQPSSAALAYETLWLELAFELCDARGERAVLTRRQRVRVLAADVVVLRELVWGEGKQLARYSAQGA